MLFEHILSSCKTALTDGRYTLRHDRVLAMLADGIERARKRKREVRKAVTFIDFIRKGETATGNAGRQRNMKRDFYLDVYTILNRI